MSEPTSGPERAQAPDQPPGAEPAAAARATRPYDPERGLRGAMSATLVLEAITVLLAIPVAANTGGGVGPAGVVIICVLAVLLIGACAIVSRPYAVPVIVTLQVLMIACWVITPPLGIMGVVFGLVWALILWFRGEFRRRLAAGTLPGPTSAQQ
jgi:hypothetical protein